VAAYKEAADQAGVLRMPVFDAQRQEEGKKPQCFSRLVRIPCGSIEEYVVPLSEVGCKCMHNVCVCVCVCARVCVCVCVCVSVCANCEESTFLFYGFKWFRQLVRLKPF